MPTTTIRLDNDLKTRLAAAAARAGKTAHAFMLDAITQTITQAEHDAAFHALAETRWANLLATGATVPWEDAKTWLTTRPQTPPPETPAS